MASLRENMGYQSTMFSGHKEAVMIFSPEQALLKSQADLQALVTFARQSAADGLRIDQAERELMRRLLGPGDAAFRRSVNSLTAFLMPVSGENGNRFPLSTIG